MLTRRLLLVALLLALGVQGCGGPQPRVKAGSSGAASSTASTIKDIRMWHAPERSRIVFDMDRRAAFEVFTLTAPDRVVVDLTNARINSALPSRTDSGQFIHQIRLGIPRKNVARLVFDLDKPIRYSVQMLPPNDRYQYRLVVDIYPSDSVAGVARPKPTPTPSTPRQPKSGLLVLIDPGHGGEDPGAIGKRAHEKTVVLQIAKRLKARIDQLPGVRAELTRTGDYYIPLRKRTRIARQRQADLFVSIHADAFKNKQASGASVYALSQRGASSEAAKWLANKENSSDLVGGVSLVDKDALLAEVLLDLSMTKTVSESISFGRDVLAELKKIRKLHSERVEQAGFVVLKSPDIPSILVETAYITNPSEEAQLRSAKHQKRIANAIAAGIQRYLDKNRSRYATR